MPTLTLIGPKFSLLERDYQCAGRYWRQIIEELTINNYKLKELLPLRCGDKTALGLAYFINNQRIYEMDFFHATFMDSDELVIVHAVSGG
ncbi:hypothetical protein QWZ03_17120 [Chitinimonas viridis]|uniref:MoaD/ThiS family protein n=1 Tax=Chitinimonas viridis TaxID=664880 RepID=A0ABT8B8X6_9NEIS|nr:hypothetical protein [Chitinimonas viridis]MDN3578494.1 hypothetical protein [Chitinimonas viridis]